MAIESQVRHNVGQIESLEKKTERGALNAQKNGLN